MEQRGPGEALLMELLIRALAVLWVWEYLRLLTPFAIPAWMQPALVAGCAVGVPHVTQRIVTALAVAGAVAVLHRAVAPVEASQVVVRQRVRRLPRL